MNIWLNWTNLNNILKFKKRIFLFGRSEDWVPKTLNKLKKYKSKITIIDSNKLYKNSTFLGIDVKEPAILNEFNPKNDYIIITAEPTSIIPDLEKKFNLLKEQNFCCTPEIKNWGKLQSIKNFSSDIIFSCSDYFDLSKTKGSKLGGGIFIANVKENFYEKKLDGQFRQFQKFGENFYAVEYIKKEIHVFDKSFKVLEKYKLDQSKNKTELPNYCGITHIPQRKSFYVANSYSDEISIYDEKDFKLKDKIFFLNKTFLQSDAQYHINDLEGFGTNLIVSYFSKSGLWRNGVLDGGVSLIELDNNFKIIELISDLTKPHSPLVVHGQIYVLNSLKRTLVHGTEEICKFSGFLRGLAYDDEYFYIGQSEDVYLNRIFNLKFDNLICNAGIYQYDLNNNISRFLSTPDIKNIHDIQKL